MPDNSIGFPEPTKENTKWKRLCSYHAKEIMICPCWIVEEDECEICIIQSGDNVE